MQRGYATIAFELLRARRAEVTRPPVLRERKLIRYSRGKLTILGTSTAIDHGHAPSR